MEVNCISEGASEPFIPGGHIASGWTTGDTGDAEYIQDPLIPDFSSKPYEIYCGDARETIRRLKAGGTQFDCVVTSPPYFNQRMYGDDPREIGRESGNGGVDSFISNLVSIFRKIPVRPWASLWVNLGDKRSAKGALMGVPPFLSWPCRMLGSSSRMMSSGQRKWFPWEAGASATARSSLRRAA